MDKEIKIPKRLYDDILQYCESNDIVFDKYCALALRKQLSLDKYGDLNEKFVVKQEKNEEVKLNIIESKPIQKPEPKEITEAVVEIPQELPNEDKKEERKHRIIQTK